MKKILFAIIILAFACKKEDEVVPKASVADSKYYWYVTSTFDSSVVVLWTDKEHKNGKFSYHLGKSGKVFTRHLDDDYSEISFAGMDWPDTKYGYIGFAIVSENGDTIRKFGRLHIQTLKYENCPYYHKK